jgi:hypothetical protein
VYQKVLLGIVLVAVGVLAAVFFLTPEPASKVTQVDSTPAQTSTGTAASSVVTPASSGDLPRPTVSGEALREGVQTASAVVEQGSASSYRRVRATYFHNTSRCVTCRNIENRSREAIAAAFAVELASGQLTWRALNMEVKENEHYATDYSLPYPSLVLAELDGEREVRFKVLEETWDLVHKRAPLLEDYVVAETRAFLEGL